MREWVGQVRVPDRWCFNASHVWPVSRSFSSAFRRSSFRPLSIGDPYRVGNCVMALPKDREAFRALLTNVLERRLFFLPSFKIYGGVAGFYDFGPPGCAIKQNIQQFWRKHFILEESMLEVECPAVTPEPVLAASGHVERFTDFMVTDLKTGISHFLSPNDLTLFSGECHRADHLLEATLETAIQGGNKEAEKLMPYIEELTQEQLSEAMQKFDVKAPETKNDLSPPFPFNLMFRTSIGPKGDTVGYLRPETAQGIFINFKYTTAFDCCVICVRGCVQRFAVL